jgi:hypothetical protein
MRNSEYKTPLDMTDLTKLSVHPITLRFHQEQRHLEKEYRTFSFNKYLHHIRICQRIKKLSGLLPICSSCKKVRDDKGYWNQIESYISNHSEAYFSHSLCPELNLDDIFDIDTNE